MENKSPKFCSSCGNSIKVGSKFCANCGKSLSIQSPTLSNANTKTSTKVPSKFDEGELFSWAQYQAAKCGYNVENWTSSWKDGIAFCAIIHIHRPDLMGRVDSLNLQQHRMNIQLAINAAITLGIKNLVTTDDFLKTPEPPKEKVVLFVSALYEIFGKQSQQQVPNADASSNASSAESTSFGNKATSFADLPDMPGLSNGAIDWQNKQLQSFLKSLEVAKRVLNKEPCGNCGKEIPQDDNCGEKVIKQKKKKDYHF